MIAPIMATTSKTDATSNGTDVRANEARAQPLDRVARQGARWRPATDARHHRGQEDEQHGGKPADQPPLFVEARAAGSITPRLNMIAKMISVEMAPT